MNTDGILKELQDLKIFPSLSILILNLKYFEKYN